MSDTETKEPEATAEAPSRRGRSPSLAGQKLFPADALKNEAGEIVNPRREGTNGHRAMAIIIANPGILLEDFRAQGGRMADLKWDIAKGRVTTSF